MIVPGLAEVATFGETEAEALAMAEDAIRLAVSYRLDHGEPLPDGRQTGGPRDHRSGMSGRLPQLRARQVIRALEHGGFIIERSSGSHHLLLHRTDPRRRAIVPYHGDKDVPRGTLRNILRQAQPTVDEFLRLL